MPTRLLNLNIKRIAVVDEGDNPDADIMLIKRKFNKEILDVAKDTDKDLELTDEQKAAIVAEEVEKAKKAAEAELKKLQDKVVELEKAAAEKEGLEGQIEKLKTDVKEARELIAVQADVEAEKSAVAKIKSWDKVPGLKADDEDVLKALKAVRKSCPKQAEVIEGLIDKCNKTIGESELLKAVGSDESGAASAEAALNVKASEVQKGNPKMSWPEAFATACDQNPELMQEYNDEYMAKVRGE